MGIPCLHKGITTAVMERFQFVAGAREVAADANAAVDEKQGNSAKETNLHAMCGYVITRDPVLHKDMEVLQSAEQCRASVEDLLSDLRSEIASQVVAGNHRTALQRLGEALHTVQDRAFHNYEPWPYQGLSGAVLSDPGYMLCHAVRDLGFNLGGVGIGISRLDVWELPAGRFDIELSARIGGRVFVGGRFFHHATAPEFWQTPLGRQGGVGPLGTGGMISLSFGAPPGSVQLPDPLRGSVPLVPNGKPTWSMATSGPASQAMAEDASTEFIREVEREVFRARDGAKAWSGFVGSTGERDARQTPRGRPIQAAQPASPDFKG